LIDKLKQSELPGEEAEQGQIFSPRRPCSTITLDSLGGKIFNKVFQDLPDLEIESGFHCLYNLWSCGTESGSCLSLGDLSLGPYTTCASWEFCTLRICQDLLCFCLFVKNNSFLMEWGDILL
jgi:hypothetical protein